MKIKSLFCLLFFLSLNCLAETTVTTIKCYVELAGGGETVHAVTFASDDITTEQVAVSFQGKRIYYGSNKKKVSIYKVHECVMDRDAFRSSRANRIENELPQ